MTFLIVWSIFSIIIGFSKINSLYFFSISLLMIVITKIYNNIIKISTRISIKTIIILSCITNIIIWYLAYKCNEFLWVYPYNQMNFIYLLCLYTYILLYIFIES